MSCDNDPCVTVVAHAPGPNFKLQAVVVCNRYHYFLRCMPPQSKFHFDKMGGTLEDRVTQRVCESIAWSLCPPMRCDRDGNNFAKRAHGRRLGTPEHAGLDATSRCRRLWLPRVTRKYWRIQISLSA